MTYTFDFHTESKFNRAIALNTILHIERYSHSVARVYFTDESNQPTNIPSGLVVYTYDFQDPSKRIRQNAVNQSYALCWTDSYTIEFNKTDVLQIRPQRTWNIVY